MAFKTNNKTGFTLMELMVVIAIIGIISAIATPNVLSWLQNRKFTTSLQRTISIMNSAKLRAVKENRPTVIIFDKGQNQLRAFVELSNPPNMEQDAGTDTVIESYDMPAGVQISNATFNSAGNNKYRLVFTSRAIPANFNNGSVELQSNTDLSNEIIVAPSGRIRID